MKKMIVLMTLLTVSSVYGAESMYKSNSNYGCQKYGKETLESIQGNGSVILNGTKVSGLVQVNGSLNAEESAINTLQVNGQVGLNNCVITNTAVINGGLNADNTKFQKQLNVASQKIVLRMCTVESLTVKEVSGYTDVQIVDLRSGTTITGPILVESGNGEIWISSNSEISEEKVSGAVVYRK